VKKIGDGSGLIDRATFEEKDDTVNYNGGSFYYPLAEGHHVVGISVLSGGNYQFTFKDPFITSTLTTNSDWDNEEVRIVPTTTANVVRWLNTPTICGAFSACSIQASSQHKKVQTASNTMGSKGSVLVQGGTANTWAAPVVGSAYKTTSGNRSVVSIARADVTGLTGGMFVAVQNTSSLPKGTGVAPGITAATALTSIATDGTFVVSGAKIWDFVNAQSDNAAVLVEREGAFVSYTNTSLGSGLLVSGVAEGDWVVITTPATPGVLPSINTANTGIFRVVRVGDAGSRAGSVFWVENDAAVNEMLADCDIKFIKYDSIMPGDTLNIGHPTWGNIGAWTVKSVGNGFAVGSEYTFEVDVSSRTPTTTGVSPALGADFHSVQIIEGTPSRLIKRLSLMAPNTINGALVDLKFETSPVYRQISQPAGSIIQAFGKLAFPTSLSIGVDGYRHSTGLVGEVTRIVYGDPRDPATYPGVASSGAVVNVAGPNVRRLTIGLQLRVKSGAVTQDIAQSVKSAVASIVNKTPVGQPVALGAIVAAAQKVPGVVSVVIISPPYNSTNDLIGIQPFEKPLILNLDTDVSVTFLGA